MTTLPDLAHVIANTRTAIDTHDPSQQVSLSPAKFDLIVNSCQPLYQGETIQGIAGHTLAFVNRDGQTRNVSVQDFPVLVALAELDRALNEYKVALEGISSEMGYSSRTAGNSIFGKLPSGDIQNDLNANQRTQLFDAVDATLPDVQDNAYMVKFLSDPEWGGLADERGRVGRKLDRASDWIESAVLKAGNMVATANSGRLKLIKALANAGIKSSDLTIQGANPPPAAGMAAVARVPGGDNVLYYGGPGTGKSHAVEKITEKEKFFRTVFHPETQNADFVGTLKPASADDDQISYRFRPGPFAEAFIYAWLHPDKKTYLIIEELNRAQAAAVFGELFQLLDRQDDGTGRYHVDFPSPEFERWFASEGGDINDKLRLPSNLWIFATMNSADQGVYPLDTAFRRRWQQIYIPFNYSITPDVDVNLGGSTFKLRIFLERLNNFLVEELKVAEDRLVGPRFLEARELIDGKLPGKLLIYLWDDLLRHGGRLTLFENSIKSYGQLHERAASGADIFTSLFLASFPNHMPADNSALENEENTGQDAG